MILTLPRPRVVPRALDSQGALTAFTLGSSTAPAGSRLSPLLPNLRPLAGPETAPYPHPRSPECVWIVFFYPFP